MVEERVAQERSSLVPATMELVVGERAVEVDLLRGVRAMVEFVSMQIATTKDFVARRRSFRDADMSYRVIQRTGADVDLWAMFCVRPAPVQGPV